MNILQKYELVAKVKKPIKIGIGLNNDNSHNQIILKASLDFLKYFKSTITFFGKKEYFNNIRKQTPESKINSQIILVECQDPETFIVDSLSKNSIHAIVRGSLSSSKFLKDLKQNLNLPEINRLAILETIKGHQFFYGPVGIDECSNIEKKAIFIELALKELQKINVVPNISILSGGRLDDIGREIFIKKTIQDAINIVNLMKNKYPKLKISHDEILIEKAIEHKSNLIIAPDGISGNLIYRTLVHLGGGKAYGAIYMGIDHPIIDTSRGGDYSEFYGALLLALALSK
ncbi:MAG: methanogenesis marker protein Mmp4/MtxX [Candidatus Odinarchaeota archaeon]